MNETQNTFLGKELKKSIFLALIIILINLSAIAVFACNEKIKISWWAWKLRNKQCNELLKYSEGIPICTGCYCEKRPWVLKPKREGNILNIYHNNIVLINLGEKEMVEEKDQIYIVKKDFLLGLAIVIKKFEHTALCKTTLENINIRIGDSITTKVD